MKSLQELGPKSVTDQGLDVFRENSGAVQRLGTFAQFPPLSLVLEGFQIFRLAGFKFGEFRPKA